MRTHVDVTSRRVTAESFRLHFAFNMPQITMPNPDVLVPIGLLAGVLFGWHNLRRRGLRKQDLVMSLWVLFYGLALVLMMALHVFEVTYHLVAGGTTLTGQAWRYDFRSYSLLLLGALLIWQGVVLLKSAGGVTRTREICFEAFKATAIVLAVVVPLIPIQAFFGVILTVLSVVTLLFLAWAHARQSSKTLSTTTMILRQLTSLGLVAVLTTPLEHDRPLNPSSRLFSERGKPSYAINGITQ
jgi:hypothetical protein